MSSPAINHKTEGFFFFFPRRLSSSFSGTLTVGVCGRVRRLTDDVCWALFDSTANKGSCAHKAGAKILAKDTVDMLKSGGDRPQSPGVSWASWATGLFSPGHKGACGACH